MSAIETRYGQTPWLKEHEKLLGDARRAAKRGMQEAEAEQLYAKAADLFAKGGNYST